MNLKRGVYVCAYPKWMDDLLLLQKLQPSFLTVFLLMLLIIRIFVLNNEMNWRVESFSRIGI